MKFLSKIISELLSETSDLSQTVVVLPGKRPVVFLKQILKEQKYEGFLPEFFTVDELIKKISGKQHIQGISLWLFGYDVYKKIYPEETLENFLKWFPTLLKDWDDMLKFSEEDKAVLEYMLDDERIKNWGETLGDGDNVRKRNLNFWKKMNVFLPKLKENLQAKGWATDGMIHEMVREKISDFAEETETKFVFCGFNALTPLEEKLIRELLQKGKAECFFQADEYYIKDLKQEAGKFLRKHMHWKEFNENRKFQWVENSFCEEKSIKVYEVAGNVAQTKILPEILQEIPKENYSKTAVVLLDENLLLPSLDAVSFVDNLNITMGFPIKNLGFSGAVKKLFYLQKQLWKNDKSYYYLDVFSVLEEFPDNEEDRKIIDQFTAKIEDENIVYISKKMMQEHLGKLSYFQLFEKRTATELLEDLSNFCYQLKFREIDDILYENVSLFETTFKILKNHMKDYDFEISIDALEVLMNQLVNSENLDFQGEPLEGLQFMGLLETRLLDFENIILLSVNEGKLPLGNTQNTYLPFDVRRNFGLNTFLENDSIYAYHFYRLLQNSKNIYLLYNALGSGVNTGEKSRFIIQMEMESPHKMEHIVIENTSEPILQEPIIIEKTEKVLEKLNEWKDRISASHLISYLYNPIDFYLNNILKAKETEEIEEELSQRNYGNLVHYALEELYGELQGKILKESDIEDLKPKINEAIDSVISELKHQPELYERGMNYIHKSMAAKVVEHILDYDLGLIKAGNSLEIISLENGINAEFLLDENGEKINFVGYIDRIDRLNGVVRVIDFKTAKAKNLFVKPKEEKLEDFMSSADSKQALQLSIYAYMTLHNKGFAVNQLQCGIWSFAEIGKGVQTLKIYDNENIDNENVSICMNSIKNIILEILNPEIPFKEN